ncbi:MAG: hypothetical protein ACRD0G_12115, partial [Acidimicrobiales bacterium]
MGSWLEVAVERTAAAGAPTTRAVWLPPLPAVLTLDAVLGTPRPSRQHGLAVSGFPSGRLVFPFGLVDRPSEQRQDIAAHDFTGTG